MSSVNRASRIRGMPPFSSRYLSTKLINPPNASGVAVEDIEEQERTCPTVACASSASRRMKLASAAALARAPQPGSHTYELLNRRSRIRTVPVLSLEVRGGHDGVRQQHVHVPRRTH